MTTKIEDFFDLPEGEENMPEQAVKFMEEAEAVCTSLSTAERIDSALPVVTGLQEHDEEMDDIAGKAMRTFEDLVSLGNNVPDMHAGKIYEVAGQMLKTALDAKNAKADKKLRMIELQLKKTRLEQIDRDAGVGPEVNNGVEFDRNDIMAALTRITTGADASDGK